MNRITLILFLSILVHNAIGQGLILTPNGHSAKVNQLLYLNNSEVLSCSDDNSVMLWNIQEGKLINRFSLSQDKERAEPLTLVVDSLKKHFFTAGIIGNKDSSYIVKSEIKGGSSIEWLGHKGIITGLKMLQGDILVSAGSDSLVKFWCFKNDIYKEIGQIQCNGPIVSFDISNKRMIVSTGNNSFDLYELIVNEQSISSTFIKNVEKHFHPCQVVRFSPNGKIILSGGNDYLVNVYDANGKHLKRIKKLSNAITDIAFSFDNENALITTLLTGEVSMISIPKGKIVS